LWQRKVRLERLGHRVDVYNTRMIHNVIHEINGGAYDFVHCHNELFAAHCNAHLKQPYVVTTHFGGLHRFRPNGERGRQYASFEYLFRDCLDAPGNIVLSEPIRHLFQDAGYAGFLRTLRNAVEYEDFRAAPRGNGRAICVGMIQPRKRQAWLANAVAGCTGVDFVGPWDRHREATFKENDSARYLGVWTRRDVHERLADYSCLVMLSESEAAAPKVVLEALAAGLNVVVTEACTANLTTQPFITVFPDDALRAESVVQAIERAIRDNESMRPSIRAYATASFGYDVQVSQYLELIHQFRSYVGR